MSHSTTDISTLQTPNLNEEAFDSSIADKIETRQQMTHPPRILMLYGSLRERSYSRLLTEEAARILRKLGAEVRIFDPTGLPQPDTASADHPKVKELRELSLWSEGQVWCSPERHGNMTGIFKTQIDWLPLSEGAVRPTQGRTLAVMQVSGDLNPLIQSMRYVFSVDGCAWSQFRTSHQYLVHIRNSMMRGV
jgi:Predicted flavoprotein